MRIKTCLALALAGAFSVSAAMATSLTKMDLNRIAAAASVAIVGEVTSATTKQTDAGLVTVATVEIKSVMWGSNATTIKVAVPGGSTRVGKFRVGDDGGAGRLILNKGEQAVFLLSRASESDDYSVVGFNQGLFPINRTLEGAKVTLPGISGQVTLESAMSEIRQARSNADSKPSDVIQN